MKYKRLFKSDKQFNHFLLLISVISAIVITIINVNFFNYFTYDFKINTNHTYFEQNFIEFESNKKNKVIITKEKNIANTYSILIHNENGIIENQYNFFADDYWKKYVTYFDINNDNYKEIIFLYKRNDSLFISVIDYKLKKYIYSEEFLFKYSDNKKSEIWDMTITIGGVDFDNNREPVLYFIVNSGYAIYPRGIYSFNLISKKLNMFEFGASPFNILLFDLDKDGENEIIVSTVATGNTLKLLDNEKYDDVSSWLFIFNKNLEIISSIQVKELYSKVRINSTENKLIAFIDGNIGEKYIGIVQSDGSISNKKYFNNSLDYEIFTHDKKIFLLTNDSIFIYNEFLELKNAVINSLVKINSNLNFINIDDDSKTEYFYSDDRKVIIFDNDFSVLKVIDRVIYNTPNYSIFTYTNISQNELLIIENGINANTELKIKYITQYFYLPIYFIVILILIFLSLLIVKYFIIKISTILSYFLNSTNRSNDSILIYNSNNRLIYSNKAARRLFKIKHSFWIGKKEDYVLIKNHEFNEILNSSLNAKKNKPKELSLLLNNKYIKVRCNSTPLISPWGVVIAVYFRLEDITKEIYYERQKVLTHTVRKVAHEIKTPLSSILLNLDSIEQNIGEGNESVNYDLNVSRNEIKRIRNFINNFLKFTNSQKPTFELVEAEKLIYSSLLRFSAYMENNIKIDISGDVNEKIWCDSFQLEEVFQVFIENAIDAIGGKGIIKIHCEKIFEWKKEYLNISIQDNGPGIDERVKNVIFDPYTTTKQHGTGMGMSIAKKILEDHESKIEIHSENGVGTKIAFKLKINI